MRHLITAGLPYINGIKHLGNLVGSMLPADIYARFLRQEGEEVLWICATDEHGAPAEIAAHAASQPVAQYCAEQHGIQADIYARFGLSFDHFGRSSSPQNHALTQRLFNELDANGYIEERAIEQVYSIDDKRFLPDRYVIGTCPHCGYTAARGDQCESCTRLLDPVDLKEPRSAISGSTKLEVRSSKHLFLRLSALEPKVRTWVEKQTQWPALSRQIALKWLNEGLRDRGITRDLVWGVPVPRPGYEGKVFYVWFDAPIEYAGSTWELTTKQGVPDDWAKWWLGDQEMRYTQFMGKDNLPFHTIMFPATLIGAGKDWRLPDQIKGFHWLNYYGDKFSTSQHRGVFTDAALEIYPADYWRYALMAQVPETSDSSFTWELFAQTVNKDLADVLGNLVNRILRFSASKLGGATIPEGGTPGEAEAKLQADCAEQVRIYRESLHALNFRAAMTALRALWALGNVYVDTRAPWTAIKTNRDDAALVVRTAINLIKLNAIAAQPVIPTIAGAILDALKLTPEERKGPASAHTDLTMLKAGRPFEVVPPLVKKIEDTEIAAHKERFGS